MLHIYYSIDIGVNYMKTKRKSVKANRSLKKYRGEAYHPSERLVTYEEVTKQWNESENQSVSRNTVCLWYNNAMYKLAENIMRERGITASKEEIVMVSRSIEFQTSIREIMEEKDRDILLEKLRIDAHEEKSSV